MTYFLFLSAVNVLVQPPYAFLDIGNLNDIYDISRWT